jgi:N-acetylneuraminic acid mutarotase
MHVKAQEQSYNSKPGKKSISIDSEENVDWLINEFVKPALRSKQYLEYTLERDKLVGDGKLPADPQQ